MHQRGKSTLKNIFLIRKIDNHPVVRNEKIVEFNFAHTKPTNAAKALSFRAVTSFVAYTTGRRPSTP